jgi:nucleoside-diphosphate-sugar epimerase
MPKRDLRVLVTGAMGFVGRAISNRLRIEGFDVIAHARRPSPGIDWVADLADEAQMHGAAALRMDAVVHCAAAIPARSSEFNRDNMAATSTLIAALDEVSSLRRVVHVSTVAVYKRPVSGRWIIAEDADTVEVDDPATDPYARSKRFSELTLSSLSSNRPEVGIVHVRASSVYGPGMVATTLLPTFVRRARQNVPLVVHGARGYMQNFVHVNDIADLVAALSVSPEVPPVVNAFSDDTYGVSQLAQLALTELDSKTRIVDKTDSSQSPSPVYVNRLAKQYHPTFRRLADHMHDAA